MALLHLDGFDTYTTAADVGLRYPGSNTALIGLSTTGGRFGGGCIFPQGSTVLSQLAPVVLTHTALPIIVGGAFQPRVDLGYQIIVIGNSTGNATSGAELTLSYDTGVINLRRGGSAGTILGTAPGSYPGLWHHIELKATIADSGGTCEVRVNGVTVINYTGDTRISTTGTAGIDRVTFSGYNTSGGAWDDIYILDTTGSTLNDFVGDCRVNTLAPTSDAAVQFTRSTGASNYLTVDEVKPNSDTDYVESSTVSHIDRYGYADLAAGVTTVHAVQTITQARKTDAAARTMRNLIVSGATTGNGASYSLLTSYAPYATPFSTDPATSAAWTVSAVNGLTAGFEVVS